MSENDPASARRDAWEKLAARIRVGDTRQNQLDAVADDALRDARRTLSPTQRAEQADRGAAALIAAHDGTTETGSRGLDPYDPAWNAVGTETRRQREERRHALIDAALARLRPDVAAALHGKSIVEATIPELVEAGFTLRLTKGVVGISAIVEDRHSIPWDGYFERTEVTVIERQPAGRLTCELEVGEGASAYWKSQGRKTDTSPLKCERLFRALIGESRDEQAFHNGAGARIVRRIDSATAVVQPVRAVKADHTHPTGPAISQDIKACAAAIARPGDLPTGPTPGIPTVALLLDGEGAIANAPEAGPIGAWRHPPTNEKPLHAPQPFCELDDDDGPDGDLYRDTIHDPRDGYARAAEARELRELLAGLKASHRIALLAHLADDEKARDSLAALGLTDAAIQQLIADAKAAARDHLAAV